jgi:hypothetical protein
MRQTWCKNQDGNVSTQYRQQEYQHLIILFAISARNHCLLHFYITSYDCNLTLSSSLHCSEQAVKWLIWRSCHATFSNPCRNALPGSYLAILSEMFWGWYSIWRRGVKRTAFHIREHIVTWTAKAVYSPCRAEPTRPEPGRAGSGRGVLVAAPRWLR